MIPIVFHVDDDQFHGDPARIAKATLIAKNIIDVSCFRFSFMISMQRYRHPRKRLTIFGVGKT